MSTTTYVSTKVDLGGGRVLYVDGNSKITAGNGSYDAPAPNAFSLPHISTCPGSTLICRRSCYVHGLEKAAPEIYAQYRENERVLHGVLRDGGAPEARTFASWIDEHCRGGFRWHVSGDVFSIEHAEWIALVCRNSPVPHWIYTRSRWAVPILLKAPNLTVNISTDAESYARAKQWAGESVRLCYLSKGIGDVPADLPAGSVIFPDYPARGRSLEEPTKHLWWLERSTRERRMVCPADFFGQSESHRCGPCSKCLHRPKKAISAVPRSGKETAA